MLKPSLSELQQLCPGLDAALLQEHLVRLDDAYFQVFAPEQIAAHLQCLARLSPAHPVEVLFEPDSDNRLACTVLAFDYPAEFSLIAGILSATGFNILSGNVFTYTHIPEEPVEAPAIPSIRSRNPNRRSAQRRKIIDRFAGLLADPALVESWKTDVRNRLNAVIVLLEKQESCAMTAARHQVNEWVADRLACLALDSRPVLYPVSIEIRLEPDFTRLRVLAQDTPAFLYALSTALALQGVSIERVRIGTQAGRIEDEIDILDARGQLITDSARLDQIRLAVLLTKQFTYFVSHAPDPYMALCRFEQMVESILKMPERGQWVELLSAPHALQDLAQVLGASDYLWEDFIRLQYENLLPILKPHVSGRRFATPPEELQARLNARLAEAQTFPEECRILNEFKDREIFLIDLDHILYFTTDVRPLAEALTRLAELVICKAAELTFRHLAARYGTPRTVAGLETAWALFGLGKFGGAAMGYASDIELLFVYSDNGRTDGATPLANAEFFDQLLRTLTDSVKAKREGIFHIDLRLRPYGNAGPLACSLESFCRYYGSGGPAHAYERLALARLRAFGGNADLGARVERLRDEFIYAGQSIAIQDLRELRKKQLAEKSDPKRYNAKFSPGALVDLEYDVQILQVLHAGREPRLKTPRIHKALTALSEAGILGPDEGRRLTDAYYFLRRLINGLRMLRGSARDLFLPPEGSDEFAHLARRMGYQRGGALEPEQQLRVDFETHTAVVRVFVERHFGRAALPGSADGNVVDLILSDTVEPELRARILARARFQNPDRAYVNLRALAGREARQDLFIKLAVLAMDSLKQAADPDMALNNWERFVQVLPDVSAHYERLLSQPRRLDILLSIFSASQFLADTLIRNPDFLDWVTSSEILTRPRDRSDMEADLRAFPRGTAPADWRNAVRRFRRREILRIGTRDICLRAPIAEVTADLSTLAEVVTHYALEQIIPTKAPAAAAETFCILAFGKLGGRELNYSSDIDLLGICADSRPAQEDWEAVLKQIGLNLSRHTDEGYAYRVDFRLRPYGQAGHLVYPITRLVEYYRDEAALWEIQALLKARPIAGNLALGLDFLERVKPLFLRPRPPTEIIPALEAMRAAAAKAAGRRGEPGTDIKSGQGGIRDIEFLVQGLQLIHAHRHPEILDPNTLSALDRLKAAGLLSEPLANQLRMDYEFLRRVEHYLQIYEDRQIHEIPESPAERTALAKRVLGRDTQADQFLTELTACLARVRQAYQEHLLALAG